MRKESHLKKKLLGKLDIPMQKMKLDPYLSLCTKTNSKQIKGLNLRLEAKIGRGKKMKTLSDLETGKDYDQNSSHSGNDSKD